MSLRPMQWRIHASFYTEPFPLNAVCHIALTAAAAMLDTRTDGVTTAATAHSGTPYARTKDATRVGRQKARGRNPLQTA